MSYKNVAVLIRCETLFQEPMIYFGVIMGDYPKYYLLLFCPHYFSSPVCTWCIGIGSLYNLGAKII